MENKQQTETKASAGRPAPPGGRRKGRCIKANDMEWELIKKKAEEAGMNASDYIRKKVLDS